MTDDETIDHKVDPIELKKAPTNTYELALQHYAMRADAQKYKERK